MCMLTVSDISKKFKKKQVLEHVSCEFTTGITALLGPNGAGKSTLMNIMCTLLPADEGTVTFDGNDVRDMGSAYLERIAVLFQNQPMFKNYTADEYLWFCGMLKGLSKKETAAQGQTLLQYFGLEESRKKQIGAFSGGMRQRLALCGVFLGDPKIIFLDEPSVGLDLYEREELKRFLSNLKDNRVIILSTHIVPDIENIADRLLLLDNGRARFVDMKEIPEGTDLTAYYFQNLSVR